MTYAVNLVDGDDSAGLFLNALDGFAALTDDSANEFFVDSHRNDAWNVRLIVFAWSRNCLVDDVEDVQAALLGLFECFSKNFIRQTVALDVHLSGSDTVLRTSHLEVHIAEVVFVAKDVRQNGVLCAVGNKTHSNAGNRLLHLHTGVEQRKCAGANSCHRRRTVRLQNVANDAAGVWELFGQHTLEGTPCQVTVTDFATAYATLWLCFAC